MKIDKTGLRLSSGKTVHFKSQTARSNWEKVAQAVKHGWRPTRQQRKGK